MKGWRKYFAGFAFGAVLCCWQARADERIEKIFQQASESLRMGDYTAAEAGFREVLRAEPKNVSAMGNLGVVYSRTLRYARAIEIYKRALAISPRERGILLNLGLAYLKQDDYARAMPYFRTLHALNGADGQAATLYATCLVYGGKAKEALEVLKPLAEAKPDPATLYLLGVAYNRAGQNAEGEQVFAKMLSTEETKAQASYLLGKAYYDSDRFEEAVEAFKTVLASDPHFQGGHRELGKEYISMRRNPEAEEELQAALRDDPDD